ncbi:carbohydrate ABC transporter permease [Paenibacillus periandrae]|uniref:carbohydrate ABC transporter permease n=1 Tax=Paenibacillus periandrae TaxID=1761741 RepID=UPI001F088A48|nr:carbohydrate ABC transporter permease [Paenibacillus periandrae]
MLQHRSIPSRIFDIFNVLLLLLLVVVTAYPCLYVLFASISDGVSLNTGNKLLFWPRGLQLESYKRVFVNPMLWVGYRNTLIYVVLGTALNLLLTCFAAYGLSRPYLPGRKTMMKLIIFTMFFSGGMIPSYLLVMNLGMINTIFAMIIPGAISTWNLIILRTSFMALPPSLEESAKMDGANDFLILFRIIIPLSLPALSVILLYYAVGHWNAFFDALIYLRKREMFPIQMVLREILILNDSSMLVGMTDSVDRMQEAIPLKYATIIVSSLPVLFLYPFLQKYFVQGMMIGAIKE